MCSRGLIRAILTATGVALSLSAAAAIEVIPVLPIAGATDSDLQSPLRVMLGGSAEAAKVSFFYRQAPASVRPNFMMVVLPDTQRYSGSVNGATPEMFYAQTDWIVSNRAASNIVYVTQVGDVVQNVNWYENEWWVATNAMFRLENPLSTGLQEGVTYGIAPGDHDGPPYTFYNKYFGVDHFAGRSYYGGHYGTNNNNSFVLFSASGLDFVSVHLEYAPNSNILAWANQVINAYSNRHAIVVSHSILFPSATGAVFNMQGQPIYDALKTNSNLFMMLCGNHPTYGFRVDRFGSNTITSLLSDYSYITIGTNGYMRLMDFSPSNNTISVRTYSPFLNIYYPGTAHQFSFPFNMSVDDKGYQLVETVDAPVSAGTPLQIETLALPTLSAGTRYEWFVRVESPSTNYNSPVWSFTTRPTTNPTLATFKILSYSTDAQGRISFEWASVGQRRYRIEYCDGGSGGVFTGQFTDLQRTDLEELDPSPEGAPSTQRFTDNYEYTQGPPPHGARFFRVRELR